MAKEVILRKRRVAAFPAYKPKLGSAGKGNCPLQVPKTASGRNSEADKPVKSDSLFRPSAPWYWARGTSGRRSSTPSVPSLPKVQRLRSWQII